VGEADVGRGGSPQRNRGESFHCYGKGERAEGAEFLIGKGIDILYTREDFAGKGPTYVFSDAEVEVRNADVTTLEELFTRDQVFPSPDTHYPSSTRESALGIDAEKEIDYTR
jgi:hypothetical protein